MANKIILLGNLTRDIQTRQAANMLIANTGIAVNEKRKDANGGYTDKPMFIDLTFFGRTAEVAAQYLSKGSKVMIEGKLELQQWQDNNGVNHSKHAVIVQNMEMINTQNGANAQNYAQNNTQNYANTQARNLAAQAAPQNDTFSGGDDNYIPF